MSVAAASNNLNHNWSPMVSCTYSYAFCPKKLSCNFSQDARDVCREQTLPSKGYVFPFSPYGDKAICETDFFIPFSFSLSFLSFLFFGDTAISFSFSKLLRHEYS